MLCYVMLCYVMLCYVMLCYVMLCYIMLCYVMLCYVMLCYVMLQVSLTRFLHSWYFVLNEAVQVLKLVPVSFRACKYYFVQTQSLSLLIIVSLVHST